MVGIYDVPINALTAVNYSLKLLKYNGGLNDLSHPKIIFSKILSFYFLFLHH